MLKFIKNVFRHTLTYKFFNTIKSIVNYIKSKHYISDTLYSKELKYVLDNYLHTNIKKDWLGRLYCVVNPGIDNSGEFNISNMIIEMDGDNTNNHEYIKQWTYKQMKLIAQLFKIEKLYDYINIEFTHIGPENQDNYLIVFDIVARKELSYSLKKLCKQTLLYIIILGVIFSYYVFI